MGHCILPPHTQGTDTWDKNQQGAGPSAHDTGVQAFLNKTADMTGTLYAPKWQSLLLDIVMLQDIFTKGEMKVWHQAAQGDHG